MSVKANEYESEKEEQEVGSGRGNLCGSNMEGLGE